MIKAQDRLDRLPEKSINYDPDASHAEADGWRHDDYRQPLGREAPGPPEAHGIFARAQHLLRDYEVADPRLVRAHYDPDAPLEGRNMLLELRFHRIFSVWAGCRVGQVTDERRTEDGREAQVWGWPYMTLEGHVEQGQMDWQVWKFLDTGEVEFRIHAFSRGTPEGNPIVRLGFRLIGQRERERYLSRACERMARFTAQGTA